MLCDTIKKELVQIDYRIKKDIENKEYRITQAGKSEYSRILKYYDLDYQTILEEETKRIDFQCVQSCFITMRFIAQLSVSNIWFFVDRILHKHLSRRNVSVS